MNNQFLLHARYPIVDTDDHLEIFVGKPEFMPPLTRAELEESLGDHSLSEAEIEDWVRRAADDTSKKVIWKITAPDLEQDGYSCGIDDLQSMLLALQSIDLAIAAWEQAANKKCQYTYTIATKITTQIPADQGGGL